LGPHQDEYHLKKQQKKRPQHFTFLGSLESNMFVLHWWQTITVPRADFYLSAYLHVVVFTAHPSIHLPYSPVGLPVL
jgi:hypothetical protein